jgi:hypothetical protein
MLRRMPRDRATTILAVSPVNRRRCITPFGSTARPAGRRKVVLATPHRRDSVSGDPRVSCNRSLGRNPVTDELQSAPTESGAHNCADVPTVDQFGNIARREARRAPV